MVIRWLRQLGRQGLLVSVVSVARGVAAIVSGDIKTCYTAAACLRSDVATDSSSRQTCAVLLGHGHGVAVVYVDNTGVLCSSAFALIFPASHQAMGVVVVLITLQACY